jgi:hypothetical protein
LRATAVTLATVATAVPDEWVLLAYRLPREPSTPRIAVWRKLKRLGAAQLGDGVVALPRDERTREALEWLAQEVVEAAGDASVWLARPATQAEARALAASMAAGVAAEYATVIAEASAATDEPPGVRRRTLERLRREVERIARRDYFPPAERERADAALAELGATLAETPA